MACGSRSNLTRKEFLSRSFHDMETLTKLAPAQLLQSLCHFHGSESFERIGFRRGDVVTEGVKYLVEQAGAYWLAEAIASYQSGVKFRGETARFQAWFIAVNASEAVLWCEFDTGVIVAQQHIPYTDFPLGQTDEDVTKFDADMAARLRNATAFKLFAAQNELNGVTIMLPGEY